MLYKIYNRFIHDKLPIVEIDIPDEIPYNPIEPIQCFIYEYIYQGKTIYVGQTQTSLEKRDHQHRNSNKTYFDCRLNSEFKNAQIQLIVHEQFSNKEEGRDWMDRWEYVYILKRQCLRSQSKLGCNTNRPRHFQKTQEDIVINALKNLDITSLQQMNIVY